VISVMDPHGRIVGFLDRETDAEWYEYLLYYLDLRFSGGEGHNFDLLWFDIV
jgi:hypothetical protein